MQEAFVIFRKFANYTTLKKLQVTLEEEGIPSVLADDQASVDVTFTGGAAINTQYEIRLRQSDFKRAEELMETVVAKEVEEVGADYYLFQFTDEELYDILLKSDEWNTFDYVLAQKILKERGKPIDDALLGALKRQRLEMLAKPEENQQPWIIVGYVFAILGGFLGLIIGYFLWTSKKTLPNGTKVFSYAEKDRKQGKIIFYVSLIVFPISLLLRLSLY